jgi:hypothetical protein
VELVLMLVLVLGRHGVLSTASWPVVSYSRSSYIQLLLFLFLRHVPGLCTVHVITTCWHTRPRGNAIAAWPRSAVTVPTRGQLLGLDSETSHDICAVQHDRAGRSPERWKGPPPPQNGMYKGCTRRLDQWHTKCPSVSDVFSLLYHIPDHLSLFSSRHGDNTWICLGLAMP